MKIKIILPAILLQLTTVSLAFSQTTINDNGLAIAFSPKSYQEKNISKRDPSFAGGTAALTTYMRTNLRYPERARKQGIEGTVTLEYYVTANGTIENVTVVNSAHHLLDTEAIRLVKNMPVWHPAIRHGSPATVKYQLPVTFDLLF